MGWLSKLLGRDSPAEQASPPAPHATGEDVGPELLALADRLLEEVLAVRNPDVGRVGWSDEDKHQLVRLATVCSPEVRKLANEAANAMNDIQIARRFAVPPPPGSDHAENYSREFYVSSRALRKLIDALRAV